MSDSPLHDGRRANALAGETSPYLLQHAYNPVDWMPWGEAALAKARAENKLIFVSIGYAACHWCHVMEHESFEDEQVAEALNQSFVSVKVDREERPDLDEIYMTATMLYTGGHGGWPMSVFLAPDLRPVYAGTYFPKDNAYGRPGFLSVLRILADRWAHDPASLTAESGKVIEIIRQNHVSRGGAELLSAEQVRSGAQRVYDAFDRTHGGLPSGSNRFPPSQAMELLLRVWRHGQDPRFLPIVELTLEKMGQGGIYDHLGGGIARYSTDPKWLVPHFEKMLYDQALVASIYADGYQAASNEPLRALCRERALGICDYVLRDLTAPEGGFYSSEDADSEGLEGKFYIWTREEVVELLGAADARIFCSHYDISEPGNWMHPGDAHVPSGPKNILQVVRSAETIAQVEGMPLEEVERSLAASRRKLFEARSRRVRPGLDDKVLSGWNGLMIGALARVAAVFGEPRYADAAGRAADFALANLVVDGRLLATWGKGRAQLTAYAADYAFLVEGLLELFQATGDFARLEQAERLLETALAHYWDAEAGGFFFTADDAEELLVRSKTVQDGATPAANSVMLANLLRLAALLDRPDLREKTETVVRVFGGDATARPFQSERFLSNVDLLLEGFVEIVIVGDPAVPETQALLRTAYRSYLPNKLVVPMDPAAIAPEKPLFSARTMLDGKPTAFVCREYVCRQPVTEAAELAAQLTS
ncbi:MAG: DUF255 domain-containing protein [Acidobacteria bacterium]|nr:DUF255 domain-containing protein [Acidobacteriota bacterium]